MLSHKVLSLLEELENGFADFNAHACDVFMQLTDGELEAIKNASTFRSDNFGRIIGFLIENVLAYRSIINKTHESK